jgi:predicted molibdopterin-dependent oxidoreductase YjgC
MTSRSTGLAELNDEGYVEISPEDAESLCLCDGDRVDVTSRRGTCVANVRVAPGLQPGVVFMPFHFVNAPANRLTSGAELDPNSKMPGLKTTPVRISHIV